jgi:class 3 adenylate cyclase
MSPAIAVNSNDRLDYFGRTVNMAARIQGLSQGDDILISQEVLNDPQVKELVSRELKTVYPFYAELKGIPGTVPLIRLLP